MVFSISIRQTTSLTGRADSSANPPPQGTILRFLKLFVCFYQPGILSTLNILYFSLLSNTADFLHPACLVERSGIMPRIFKKKKKLLILIIGKRKKINVSENPVTFGGKLNSHWLCVHICDWLRLFLEAENFLCFRVLGKKKMVTRISSAFFFFFFKPDLSLGSFRVLSFTTWGKANRSWGGRGDGSGDWVRRSWIYSQ